MVVDKYRDAQARREGDRLLNGKVEVVAAGPLAVVKLCLVVVHIRPADQNVHGSKAVRTKEEFEQIFGFCFHSVRTQDDLTRLVRRNIDRQGFFDLA